MINRLKNTAAFRQHLRVVGLTAACMIGLNGCTEQLDVAENTRTSPAALRRDSDEADSGTAAAYQPCDQALNDCGGNNALCASYVADAGTQFCAPFCQLDATCPVIDGFSSGCNFAWCAVLCNDGQCPAGMACLHEVSFLDAQGNDSGTRDICITAPVSAGER